MNFRLTDESMELVEPVFNSDKKYRGKLRAILLTAPPADAENARIKIQRSWPRG